MTDFTPITLVLNGFTLALALGFMLIALWYDSRKRVIQFYAAFMMMVTLWNLGSLVVQVVSLLPPDRLLLNLSVGLMELGYGGASVSMYIFVTLLSGTHVRRLSTLAFLSLGLLVAYRLFILITQQVNIEPSQDDLSNYRLAAFSVLFFATFDVISVYLIWLYRRKIRDALLIMGMIVFVIGQAVALFNPELGIVSLSTVISSVGALMISSAIIRQEIITPIGSVTAQLNTVRGVSLSILSQLDLDVVLNQISVQSAQLSGADAVGLFLRDKDTLELVNVYNLPADMKHLHIRVGEGIVGKAAQSQQSLYVENYDRDWKEGHDLAYARSTFGAVVCVPLRYREEVIGVLMVIAGKQGRLFRREEIQVLELLGAQAAVALAHSRLFTEVESARSTLETVLVSTENPVVAFAQDHTVIFANPAVNRIPTLAEAIIKENVHELVLPDSGQSEKIFELRLDDKDYLCHVAQLGSASVQGWVAVMQDVTQLKELDRMKSEMVRMVSHDLKNPLMGALLYIDLLRDTVTEPQEEMLSVIEQQLERMQRIIRGVLDVEKVRSTELNQEVLFARPMIYRATQELKGQAESRSITLEGITEDDTLSFIGDHNQFERALVNLLENAIKFTPEGGIVRLRASRHDNQLVFSVEDNGIGIPPEMQERVFERFFRGRQHGVEHVTGSGLGLSIVKTIVDNHKGKIWLESIENKGTTFFIAVPLADLSAIKG